MHLRAHSTRLLLQILIVSTLLLATSALAVERTLTLPLAAALDPDRAAGRDLAEVVRAPGTARTHSPALIWWYALEEGERIGGADLINLVERPVARLDGDPGLAPLIGSEGTPARRDAAAKLYPADFAVKVSEPRALHGRLFQSITVPAFRLAEGELRALVSSDLRIAIEPAAGTMDRVRPLRPGFPAREKIISTLGASLLNPDALPAAGDRAVGGGGFPTDVPDVEGAAVEMVIITVEAYADLCEPYAEFKTDMGVPTVVRTLDWIQTHYPYGCDRPEMIRNFIIDAYEKWSIGYVLLVGDSDVLPPRYAFSTIFEEDVTSPADMYFACLDGDWNADHDALWAEVADPQHGEPGDDVDFLAEISVGRLAPDDRTDCAVQLEKSRRSQEAANTPYQDRILMLGEVLFPLDYPTDPNIIIDGAGYCETIYINSTGPEHDVTRLYENYTAYPDAEPLSVAAARDSLDHGFGVVIHNGHGARQTMSVATGSLDAYIVNHLENGDNTFLLCMVNCTAAAFDFNCISELFLSNPNGGAHTVIGSTRESFANVNATYLEDIFDILYTESPQMRIGDVYMAAMARQEPLTGENNGYRWAHSTFVLLGDPSNRQHYRAVDTMRLQMDATHEVADGPYGIQLVNGASEPVTGALVTIRRGDEAYRSLLSDATGLASFDLRGETPGAYQVRVSRRDFSLASGAFTTTSATAPLLSIAGVTIEDETVGDTVGNGNGIAEPGETIRLLLPLGNGGDVDATSVTAQLTSGDPGVTIVDGAGDYGIVPSGSGGTTGGGYLVQILQPADDAILPFALTVTTAEGSYGDDFFLEAAAPRLTFDRAVIDDAGGDGQLDDGESAGLILHLRNTGRGFGQGVTATLEAVAGGSVTVVQGTSLLGDLDPLAADLGPAVFAVSRDGVEPTSLRLLLTDMFGRTDSLLFDLELPVSSPANITFESGTDVTRLRVNWEPMETNVAAYAVLRAEAEAGPFVEVSGDWILHSNYEDSGLTPYKSYWYKVRPLSAAGLRGELSDAAAVTTNPAQKQGWPVICGKELAGTPVIADVDADGALELIVGSEVLYGFNHDGTELCDGDGDPQTIGPMDTVGSNLYCSLTADDIDRTGGVEVVACSWDTGEVFVYTFTDTPTGAEAHMAEGWPQATPHGYGLWSTPSIGDVDGDGVQEIFLTDVGGYLMAWHYDGSEVVDGDNNPGTSGVFATGLGGWVRSSPSLADLNGDGSMEIIIGTATGNLNVYLGDGRQMSGFPYTGCEAVHSSPCVGDIDGDGLPEIAFPAEDDSLHVVNHDGTPLAGFPVPLVNESWALCPSLALADVTGDGKLEMFVSSVEDYHVMEVGWIDYQGQWLPGWPRFAAFSTQSSPAVGDIDGDGDFEAILGNEFASIEAWHHDGTPVAGFPLVTGDYVRAVPTLADIDRDGLLDMTLTSWDKSVYIWEFPVEFTPETIPWSTFRHDQRRTGNMETMDWVVGVPDDELNVPGLVRLDRNWPNPFNPVTNIRFTIGDAADGDVELAVYDARGRKVRDLVRETLLPGTYSQSWDGRDDAGHPLASGVYFARLRLGGRMDSRKMTLLK